MGAPLGQGSRFAPRHRQGRCSKKISVVRVFTDGRHPPPLGPEASPPLRVLACRAYRQRGIVPTGPSRWCSLDSAAGGEQRRGARLYGDNVEWSPSSSVSVLLFTSAQDSSNTSATVTEPTCTAKCNGVPPSLLALFASARCWRSTLTTPREPLSCGLDAVA